MAARPARSILFREMVVGTNTRRHTPRLHSRRYAIEGLEPGRFFHSSPPIMSTVPGPSITIPAIGLGAEGE